MIELTDKWKMCPAGHYVYDRTTCARCDGFSTSDWKKFPYVKLGDRIAVQYNGNLYPMEKADVANGWHPSRPAPSGWFFYYMTFFLDGVQYWKVGISQKPLERLAELGPKILHLEYYKNKETAYAREQSILRQYKVGKIIIPQLRRKGPTEIFKHEISIK